MFAVLPDAERKKRGAAPVYSVAIVGLIWLPIPFWQWSDKLPEHELLVVVRAATTNGRGEKPLPTGIRGNETPETLVLRASGEGRRSASSAARSTTRPTIASLTKSRRLIPRPRISISPCNSVTGRTNNSPA